MTLSPILILRFLGLDPSIYGLLMTLGAIGGLAGSVLAMTDAGLDTATASVDAASVSRRSEVLRRLQSHAARALADAANAAALHLAYRS